MRRTFIAIKTKLDENALELLRSMKDELQGEKIKWVDDSNFHLTLFFIGDTAENLIKEVIIKLKKEFLNFSSFELVCKSFGIFRNIKTPRALWFGFEESQSLNQLQKKINNCLKDLGVEVDDSEFKPHLTIGRTKFISDKNLLKSLIEKYEEIEIQRFLIDEVIFYESILTSKGAIYKEIEKFRLNISSL